MIEVVSEYESVRLMSREDEGVGGGVTVQLVLRSLDRVDEFVAV